MNSEPRAVTACVIDDDRIFTFGITKLMEITGLFSPTMQFINGQEAINFLSNPENGDKLPDVIFVDINMPVMNGWEFTRSFEEIKPRLGKNIPVYMVSSSVDLNDIQRAKINPTLKDYIMKPINTTHLTNIFNSLNGDIEMVQYN
ncbi:response regulator [Mucilaginibacter pallidiroseus]|uniref:Response regulator n=1 Tax=Mucilaginibacter pallidiroseus TaxID=2599295 RepID=A0A563U879_9SPHI|nr:response regulator [Mucilaginibacter pallidiroseus]TWR27550.1 response regulator [Mucilaginibacter pallidiroseus]